jgi:hypothetical protein
MEEDLSTLWGNFSLTEDEVVELSFQKEDLKAGETYGQACVLGKLVADRLISREKIRESMIQWWKPSESLSFKVLGDNLFLIEFINPKDKEKVLEGRPWVFEGSLFLVEDFNGTKTPSQFSWDRAAFWVRMVNLPLACMDREVGRKIGSTVGIVEAVDTDARGMGWGQSLRVKIQIDLAKPLQRGRKINVEGTPHWVTFQYERLPKFCFQCGVICHGKSGCPRRSSFRQQETNQYGPWLRAPSPTRRTERTTNRVPANKGTVHGNFHAKEGHYHREGRHSRPDGENDDFSGEEPGAGKSKGRYGKSNNEGTNLGENRGDFDRKFTDDMEYNGSYGNLYQGWRNKSYDKKRERENDEIPDLMGIKAKYAENSNFKTQKGRSRSGDLMKDNDFEKEQGEAQLNKGSQSPLLWREKSCRRAVGDQGIRPHQLERDAFGKVGDDNGNLSIKDIHNKQIPTLNGEENGFNAQINYVRGAHADVGQKSVMNGEAFGLLGVNKKVESPGGSSYPGPLLTEVEKNIKAAQSERAETALITWKRKFGEDSETHTTELSPTQLAKKKRGVIKEGKQVEKSRKLSGKLNCSNGSGMAEAVEQPRRPQ